MESASRATSPYKWHCSRFGRLHHGDVESRQVVPVSFGQSLDARHAGQVLSLFKLSPGKREELIERTVMGLGRMAHWEEQGSIEKP